MPSWESVTALSTLGVTIITGAVAYGKLRQRVADMGKQIVINTQRVANCEEKASSSEGDRREIMAKLENLVSGQKEMRDLLIQHITKEVMK